MANNGVPLKSGFLKSGLEVEACTGLGLTGNPRVPRVWDTFYG